MAIAESVTGKTGENAENAIAADPALQIAFQQKILDNEMAMNKMYLDDIHDARQRDIEIKKSGYKNTRADIMVIVVGVALVVNIVLLWHNPNMPEGIIAIFNMMIGALLKMLGDAYSFEFGSSRGSKEKDIK